MKWLVTNALSRDVERQQLNKILKEIEDAVATNSQSSSDTQGSVEDAVGAMVEGNDEQGLSVTYDPTTGKLNFAVNDFIIRLTGDVTGQGTVTGLRNVSIPVTIDPDKLGVEEAPNNSDAYWRTGRSWEMVPYSVRALSDVGTEDLNEGFLSVSYDAEGDIAYAVRDLEAVAGELTVSNGDGKAGNPTYGLADLADTGLGTAPIKLITRDSKGRLEGTQDATAANLPYVDTTLPPLGETDVQGAIEAVAGAVAPFLGLAPTDGDILEYDGPGSSWATTKSPRELYIDGGNF